MFGKNQKNDVHVDYEMFTIYDTKIKKYRNPTYSENHLSLIRELLTMMKDPGQAQNQFFTNAEDFQIFRIATYDKNTGKITSFEPEHIANMHELKAMAVESPRPVAQ